MTETGESVALLIDEILEHDEADCPFCKENTPPEKKVSNITPDWDEDKKISDEEYITEQIDNNAGKLERNMAKKGAPRPTDWTLEHPVYDCHYKKIDFGKEHKVTPNPHHLIPGNESLKEAPEILKWMFKSEGHITEDIGYDVNNVENGIWLPSNNSMRGNPAWKCHTVKITYANAAQPGRGCFHDRHKNYSIFVRKLLDKIADRMDGIDALKKCPYKTEKNKVGFNPPYSLIDRLNGVSKRLKGYLTQYNPDGFRDPLYTSKLVEERVCRIVNYDASRKQVPIECSKHR